MRWSLSILPSLLWLLTTTTALYLGDESSSILNKTLLRRVRGPGGDGGNGKTPTTSDLFLVGDSSLKGGCTSRLEILDEWLKEAIQLHEAAKTVYSGYRTNAAYAVLINQFFGFRIKVTGGRGTPKTYDIVDLDGNSAVQRIRLLKSNWKMIGDRIAAVSEFLAGAGLRNPLVPGEAPRIFCSGEGAELAGLGDATKDKTGKPVVTARDPNTNEPTEYLTIQRTFNPETVNIFWMNSFNGYIYLNKYTPDDTDACPVDKGGRSRYAITNRGPRPVLLEQDVEFGKSNRLIMFCPIAFEPGQWIAGKLGNSHTYPSLAQAVSPENYPSGDGGALDGLGLDNIMPVSATFYHELYHLTDNQDTSDYTYKLVEIRQTAMAGQGTNTNILKNPETFAFFAMAAYMTVNAPEGVAPIVYVGGEPWKVSNLPI